MRGIRGAGPCAARKTFCRPRLRRCRRRRGAVCPGVVRRHGRPAAGRRIAARGDGSLAGGGGTRSACREAPGAGPGVLPDCRPQQSGACRAGIGGMPSNRHALLPAAYRHTASASVRNRENRRRPAARGSFTTASTAGWTGCLPTVWKPRRGRCTPTGN